MTRRLLAASALVLAVSAVPARAQHVRALALTDMALAADPAHRRTLEVRLAILQALDRRSKEQQRAGLARRRHSRRRGAFEVMSGSTPA